MRTGRGSGFTLIELLVVVAVLALLAGLLFPVLAQARARAHRTTCLSRLHQIGLARRLCLDDADERFSDWWQLAPHRPEPFGWFCFWPEYLRPYLRSEAICHDPAAVWEEPPGEIRLADYTMPTWGPGGRGTQADPYWRWAGPPLSMAQVSRPAETVHLLDGWTTTHWTVVRFGRHGGGINVGFLDGHAGWLTEGNYERVDTDGRGYYWKHYVAADR
jgi:prepilin-type N-terminal cleavage/methylation domain-containing protein/prepilin-type processing-associated H-X9-DG protein